MRAQRIRFVAFFLTALSVLSLAYGYAGWRAVMLLPPGGLRAAGWGLVALCLLALPLSFLARALYEENHPGLEGVAWVAYVGLGIFSLLATFFVLRDMLALGWRLGSWLFGIPPLGTEQSVWLNGVVTGSALVLFAYGFFVARRDPRVRTVPIVLGHCPPGLAGFRIVQLSDIHIGPTIKKPFVERLVKRVNGLEADIVVITGDLVDGSVRDLSHDAAPLAGLTERPVFFVTGNHEYYSGARDWIRYLETLGIRTLLNEHVTIKRDEARLVVAGVTDITAHQIIPAHLSDPFRALAGAEGDVRVMLAHQPRSVRAAAEAGADLVLSGHTHGGQYFPATLIVALVQPFVSGLARFRDTQVYVNPGTGYWGPPLRLGTRSEITVLELQAAGPGDAEVRR